MDIEHGKRAFNEGANVRSESGPNSTTVVVPPQLRRTRTEEIASIYCILDRVIDVVHPVCSIHCDDGRRTTSGEGERGVIASPLFDRGRNMPVTCTVIPMRSAGAAANCPKTIMLLLPWADCSFF
jgi:hypothetical protein